MARPMSRAEAKSSAGARSSGESSSRLVDRMLGLGAASSRSSKSEAGNKSKSGERDSPTSRTRGASHLLLLDRADMDPEDLLEHHMNVLISRHSGDLEQAASSAASALASASTKALKKDKAASAKKAGGKQGKRTEAAMGSSASSRSKPEAGKSSDKQAASGAASKRSTDRLQSSSAPADAAGALRPRSRAGSDSSENVGDTESSKHTVDLSTVDTDTDPECEQMEEMSDEYTMDGDYHMMDDMDPDELALEDELAFEDDDYEMHYAEHLRGRRLDILLGDQPLPSNMNLFQARTAQADP